MILLQSNNTPTNTNRYSKTEDKRAKNLSERPLMLSPARRHHVLQNQHVLVDDDPSSYQHGVLIPAVELHLTTHPTSTTITVTQENANRSTCSH